MSISLESIWNRSNAYCRSLATRRICVVMLELRSPSNPIRAAFSAASLPCSTARDIAFSRDSSSELSNRRLLIGCCDLGGGRLRRQNLLDLFFQGDRRE